MPRIELYHSDHWNLYNVMLTDTGLVGRKSVRKIPVFAPNDRIAELGSGAFKTETVKAGKPTSALEALGYGKKVSSHDLELFYGSWADVAKTGGGTALGLQNAAVTAMNPFMRGICGYLRETIGVGTDVAEAMSRFPTVFPREAYASIKAGLEAGKLPDVLKQLGESARSANKLKTKLLSALVEPAFLGTAIIAALMVCFYLILPGQAKNFKGMNLDMGPFFTTALSFAEWLKDNWWTAALPPVMVMFLFVSFPKIVKTHAWQRNIIRVPKIGEAFRGIIVVRSLKALSLLIGARVNASTCYEIAATVSANVVYDEYFRTVLKSINEGKSPDEAFLRARSIIGPPYGDMIASQMAVAATSGKPEEGLGRMVVTIEEKVDAMLDLLPKLIQPLTMAIGAVCVLLIAVLSYGPNLYLIKKMRENLNGGPAATQKP